MRCLLPDCRRQTMLALFGLLLFGARFAHAGEKMPTITVHTAKRACYNTPVTVTLPSAPADEATRLGSFVMLSAEGKDETLAQVTQENGQTRLTFILRDLPAGETRTYHAHPVQFFRDPTVVRVKPAGDDLEITLHDKLFTRYTTHSGPNKPFFYPILTPEGESVTRHWPLEDRPGETHDHPHHRGLWFTHGSVNGVDFWSEEKGAGKTVNKSFSHLESGVVYGGFTAQTDWRTLEDTLVATDTREVRIYSLPNGDRLMDFVITITPDHSPLVFGDTKEGMFGLRLADTLAPARKEGGHIESSTGKKDTDVWGKAAEWVDNWGPIAGQPYGVAIFDAPGNIRHPETWHARDYGLFTINPFGLHDFGLGPKGAGDYTVPQNGKLTFHYRLLFHKGDTATAHVADQYAAFAEPPTAEAHW